MVRVAMVFLSAVLGAQAALAQDVAGSWMFSQADSSPLRVFVRVSLKLTRDRQDMLTGTWMEVGHYDTNVLLCTAISFRDTKLSFLLEGGGATTATAMSFNGALSADGKSITGFLQGPGINARMKFDRVGKVPAAPPSAPPTAPPPSAASVARTGAQPTPADSSAVLSRALEKLAPTRQLLLKYTCLETIERSYYTVPAAKLGTDAMNEAPKQACGGREFGQDGRLTLTTEDRLRLQVAFADGKEIDSWASAGAFDSRSIFDLVSTGPVNTGAFGSALVGIFENAGAHYTFLSAKSDAGRDLFTYSYDVPLDASNYRAHWGTASVKTAYHGTFDIDAQTADLVRVVSETAELPPEAQACRYRTSTDYRYAPVGNGQYLIPQKGSFDALVPNGNETHSAIEFSGCHEYNAESTVTFGGEGPAAATPDAPKTQAPLPAGLPLTLALGNAIDVRTAAAGDAVTAKVTKAVRAPGSDEIVVAAGAIAHGRLLAVRHQIDTGQYLISIRYDTLEQNGAPALLALRLDRELKAAQAPTKNSFASRGTEFVLPPASPANELGSWFTLSGIDGRPTLAAGSESKWVTVAQ